MDDNNKMTDNELICRYRNGDFVCFNTLLERYQAKVYGYIFSVVKHKDMANEIFQETFYKVINDIVKGQYIIDGKFVHWVIKIAHSLIDEYFHNNKTLIVSNTPECEVVDKRKFLDKNTKFIIRKLVKMLPPEQRRVFILRYYGKCDFYDIASRIGVNINTVLDRMRYATINLRRLAKENNMDIDL